MEKVGSIEEFRSFYAAFIVKSAGSWDPRLIDAFASVERECYLGAGPWSVFVGTGYTSTISDDPRIVYQDAVIALDVDRGINNGQPSLHARCLAACAPKTGETVLQVGVGHGYYSAILATLVGETGRVVAYEIEPDLARQAGHNLGHLAHIEVIAASAAERELPVADVIYVSAGATHPLALWLDALKPGGRLVFPLTPDEGFGVMLLVTRRAEDRYAATVLIPVSFIPCIGARDSVNAQAVGAAMRSRSMMATRSLVRSGTPDETACCSGDGWWLSSAAVE